MDFDLIEPVGVDGRVNQALVRIDIGDKGALVLRWGLLARQELVRRRSGCVPATKVAMNRAGLQRPGKGDHAVKE